MRQVNQNIEQSAVWVYTPAILAVGVEASMHLPEAQRHRIHRSALLSWVLLLAIVAIALEAAFTPPAELPATAAATEFSSARAMRLLEAFTKSPHPIGSIEHEWVQQYLVSKMRDLGLNPAVETHTGVYGAGHRFNAARVSNIVGRLKGADSARAVMLVAHYDTVDRAPGAGDDGGGVAAILETVRAIKAGSQLKNDVVVLLTDGEELSLLGARAAVAHDPWLQQVGVVFNFDGRGDQGPSEMFETSSGNSGLIRDFMKVAPYKTGSSLLYTIYQHLPNDTDYTVFKKAGLAGLNFAWIGRWEAYHSRLDTPENLDRRGLQQEGSNALKLTRAFGNIDLNKVQTAGFADEVYFNVLGTWMLHYPGWLVAPLTGLLTLTLAMVLLYGLRRGPLSIRTLLRATGVPLLLVLITSTTCVFVLGAERLIVGKRMQLGDTPANTCLFLGVLLFGTAIWLGLFRYFREQWGTVLLAAGGCLLAWAVVILMTVTLPLASYVLFWPLVCATLSLGIELRPRDRNEKRTRITAAWLCAIPTLLLLVPIVYFFYVALFLGLPVVVLCGSLLSIGLLLTTPLASLLAPSRLPVWMLLLAGGLAIFVGAFLSRPTAQHPQPDTLVYQIDADTGKAQWASFDRAVDPWTAKVMTNHPKHGKLIWPGPIDMDGLVADAPTITLAAPDLRLVSSSQNGSVRTVQMQLTSLRGASWLRLQMGSEADILEISVNGEEIQDQPAKGSSPLVSTRLPWALNMYGYGATAVTVTLKLRGTFCLAMLADEQYGLPQMVGPRPENRMAWYGSDYTVVTRHAAVC